MRIKRLMLLIIVFLILITFKIYAPKANHVIHEEPENLIHETPDIKEPEVIFTYSPLSDEVIERITGTSYKENDEVSMLEKA